MKVKELQEILKDIDPELSVVVISGYETGLDDVIECKSIRIIRQKNPKFYDGRYEFYGYAPEDFGQRYEGEPFTALFLNSGRFA